MLHPNPFLHPSPDVVARIRPVAERLASMDGVLPASLQADGDSYYACGPDRTVEETQRLLLRHTSFVMLLARGAGWAGEPITLETVVDLHRGIFEPVFGDATLGLRSPPRRHEPVDDDGVVFPVWVVDGSGRAPTVATRHGVRSKQVERRVRETCEGFERVAPDLVGDLDGGALAIARLYVRLIRIHPFGDGNGRTAWGIVQMAAGRLRLPFVQSSPTTRARVALGDAIRHGTRLQPLATHVRNAMWPQGDRAGAQP